MYLAESLVKMTSFLVFMSILKRFSVSFLPGVKPPSTNPVYKHSLSPKPLLLVFKRR